MPTTNPTTLAQAYLDAETDEDLPGLQSLFAAATTIRNAANPPDSGPGALERFASSFWERTERRRFHLVDAARDGDDVYALADAEITFRAGTTFGPITAEAPVDVNLVVALRFHLDAVGLVDELDVHHETTTAAVRAAATRGPT